MNSTVLIFAGIVASPVLGGVLAGAVHIVKQTDASEVLELALAGLRRLAVETIDLVVSVLVASFVASYWAYGGPPNLVLVTLATIVIVPARLTTRAIGRLRRRLRGDPA